MKKIIVSAAVAALALTTTASALEDIKVNGQAKVWYETNDLGEGLFNKDKASAEVAFKLGMTGKQGNVGFGATVYDVSTMGLEGLLVSDSRQGVLNGDMYVGEAYITAPIMGATLKLGKQELDTPLLYTERWNVTPNTYNGAVFIAPATSNLTVVGAYVGQVSSNGASASGTENGWKSNGTPAKQTNAKQNGAFALAGLYKADAMAVNAWFYAVPGVANAAWVDASMKMGAANVKAVVAQMMPEADGVDPTTAIALAGGAKMSGWNLSGAVSSVTEGNAGSMSAANIGTGGKKTKLPTAGVYTDGKFVAMPGSTAIKVKAAGKVGSTGLAIQAVNNTNDTASLETTEIDLIISQKLGDFNIKGIILNRSFADSATDTKSGGNHVRLITSINF